MFFLNEMIKKMDLRTSFIFQVNFAIILYFTCCCSGASIPVQAKNMLDVITACDSVKFLRNSSYISQCSSLTYPAELTGDQAVKDQKFMCMTLSHVTNKTCEYLNNDKSQIKVPETAIKFDEELKKLEPTHDDRPKVLTSWCQNMNSFLNFTIRNDTNQNYTKYANEILLDKVECETTCSIHGGVNPFCVVLFWFNKLHDTLQLSKTVNIPKEAPVPKQEPIHKPGADDNLQNNPVKADEHTSAANTKINKEQPKPPDTAIEIPENPKPEPVESANEQESKKEVEQPGISNKQQQGQDSKPPSSTDNKLDQADKIDNSKLDFGDGMANGDFLDEEGKKLNEEIEGENEGNPEDTGKKDPSSDIGDQRMFPESPVAKEEDESHFFMYLSVISFALVILYIGYHNKQKILAMLVEGRQSRRSRGSRRRPNTANYRKLDSNLEEAVTSQCNSNVTHVIY